MALFGTALALSSLRSGVYFARPNNSVPTVPKKKKTLYQQLHILRFLELGVPSSRILRATNFLDLELCETDLYIWEKPQVISVIRMTTMAEGIRKIHVTIGKQHDVLFLAVFFQSTHTIVCSSLLIHCPFISLTKFFWFLCLSWLRLQSAYPLSHSFSSPSQHLASLRPTIILALTGN